MIDERRGWVDRITSIVAGIVGGEANRLSPSTGGSGRPHEAHPDEAARRGPQENAQQPQAPVPIQPRPWLIRNWRPVLAGAVPGVLLGLYTGYTDSQGGFYKAVAYFPAAVAGLLFVVLLIGGALAKRSGPTIAAVAVAGAFLLGLTIGPDAPGSTQQAPGTGTVGTRADPAALWSGPVTCGWRKDESTAVEWVEGFDVPITDAAFLAARKLHDGKVTAVYLRGELGYAEDVGAYTGFPVDLEGVSSDGRTGAAVLNASGEIIFRWTCSGGP